MILELDFQKFAAVLVAEKISTGFLMQIGYYRYQIPAESQDLLLQTSKSLESSGCLFVCLLLVCSSDLHLVPVELGISAFHGTDSWFCVCVSTEVIPKDIPREKPTLTSSRT